VVWKQLRQRYLTRLAAGFLVVLVFFAIFADAIANDRPYYAKYNGEEHFPIFAPLKIDSIWNYEQGKYQLFAYNTVDWRSLPLESVVWAPIPYSPNRLDPHNRKPVPPGSEQFYETFWGEKRPLPLRLKHWMGTYTNGQDVLAGLLHGARVSLMVGVLSMLMATLIGILLGALAGYYNNRRLKASRARYILAILSVFFAWFYGFYVRRFALYEAGEEGGWTLFGSFVICICIAVGIIGIGQVIGRALERTKGYLSKKIAIPIDWWVSRTIEVLRSVPVILILISFSVVFGGSTLFLILIIGLTTWTGTARLVRAEFFRIVQLDYMEAARSLGFSERRLILRHALPNGITPVLVSLSFGIAGAIMVESGLSFLNIGVGPDTVSWGTLLRKGRSDFDIWWLTVFPGLFIFLTVLSFNLLSERLRDVLDPRNGEIKN
jgi:peptide/nickel transport system permease protein